MKEKTVKAEVIARGLIIDNKEVAVGEVINVSKGFLERSTKVAKPGSTKREISAAEKELADGQKALAEATKALDARAEELATAEAAMKEREEAVATKEAELAKK